MTPSSWLLALLLAFLVPDSWFLQPVIAFMNYLFKAGMYVYALTMAVFGVQHFMYAHNVAGMVPGWIPWPLFWAYLVGVALIAAAISIAINKYTTQACILLGIMIFLFVILIDIPPIIKQAHVSAYITDAFKEASLGGCAFILAGAKPGRV